jgi:CheY-like chemotaxis protein
MTYLYKEHRRVLLVDENARKLNLRAAILRNHEVEVHTASGLAEAASLWKVIPYDLVLLAVAENSGEAVEVTAQIWKTKPRQRVGLLVGPPAYIREVGRTPEKCATTVSPTLPAPVITENPSAPQWREMIQRVVGDWYTRGSALPGAGKLAS